MTIQHLGSGQSVTVSNVTNYSGPAVSAAGSSIAVGTVVFSDANSVSFGMNGSTVTASIARGGLSAGTASVALGTVVFSNSNGVSFGLNGSTMTASIGAGGAPGSISAGTESVALGQVVFSNSANVSFGLNGSTITASASYSAEPAGSISAGTASVALGQVVFSNANSISFGLNGSTVTASYAHAGLQALAQGVNVINGGTAVLSNANNVGFGIAGSTITASASFAQTSLAFSNLNGVSFGIAASTLTASVGPIAQLSTLAAGFTIMIDGGGSAITTGVKHYMEIPFGMTITGWTLVADVSGSIVLDVWKDTYANFPPVVGDSIAGSEKPTLSTAQAAQDLTLSTWTTALTAGDVIGINVDSATTVTKVWLTIRGTRTA